MMAPTETISAKKESRFPQRVQSVWRIIGSRSETGSKISKGKETAAMTIQGPHKASAKKRGTVKYVSVTVPQKSAEVPCKFEEAVIAECREAGMTADEIQKWIQEL